MTTAIAEFNQFDAQMREFKKQYIDVVYDLTDIEQEKRAKADKLAIGKVINKLDSKHKEMKAPLKEKVDSLDGERKRIKDDLLDIQGNIKGQLESHKQKILDHAIMLNNKVLGITELGELDGPLTSNGIKERISTLNSIDIDDSFELRKADATLAKVDTLKLLESLLTDRLKYEEEQAELERLRIEAAERVQKDREEQIRKDAEAKAKADSERERLQAIKDKEQAEKAAKDAIEAGKRQKEVAEQKAEEAKIEAKKQTDKAVQDEKDRREQERLAEIKAVEKREANKTHHAKINNQSAKALVTASKAGEQVITLGQAKLIVTAIAKKEIPNISISY